MLRYEILASVPLVAIFPLGSWTSNARKCSLLSLARSSSLLLIPAYRMRPSFVARFARQVTESSVEASISATGSTFGARKLKSKSVILFLTPCLPPPPPPPTASTPGLLVAKLAAKIGYEAAAISN